MKDKENFIKTSEFFKDEYNGIFKANFSNNFKNIFQSMLPEKFKKLTEKPEETIMTSCLNDYEIVEKYSDAVSLQLELAQKFHYVMNLDPNTAEGREARNGKSFFGFFRDKNGALHYVRVYWSSILGSWYAYCDPVRNGRWGVSNRLFQKTKS